MSDATWEEKFHGDLSVIVSRRVRRISALPFSLRPADTTLPQDETVRELSLDLLHTLYASDEYASALGNLTARFLERLVGLCSDRDEGPTVSAVMLCRLLLRSAPPGGAGEGGACSNEILDVLY